MREMTAGMTSVCNAWLALEHGVCCLSGQRHMRLTLTTASVSLILVAIFKREKKRWGRFLIYWMLLVRRDLAIMAGRVWPPSQGASERASRDKRVESLRVFL